MNTKTKILELLKGEEILAISIGEKGWGSDRKEPMFFNKKRTQEALSILDFEFDSGYGGEEGCSVYVWTKNWVIIKGCYDGSEWYSLIPRNPNKEVMPTSIGGG